MTRLFAPHRAFLPVALAVLLALVVGAGVVQAAGSVSIRDGAGFFTASGYTRITRAAQATHLRFVVITNRESFANRNAWRAWLRGQATDSGAVTIGVHGIPHARQTQQDIYVVVGPHSGLSSDQANQGLAAARPTFNRSGIAAGVVAMIGTYAAATGQVAVPQGSGSTPAPQASGGGGGGLGWLIPLLIVAAIVFIGLRLLRRRPTPTYGGGMGTSYNAPYGGGIGGPNVNSGGGSFGRGLLGGALGGLGGAWLGNQIFGNRGNDVNAGGPLQGGYDPNANAGGPTDTPDAQSLQGGWDGGGDTSGGWGSDAGGGDTSGGWGGDAGGGDSSGGGW